MLSEGAADLSYGMPAAAGVSGASPPRNALFAASCGGMHRCVNPGDYQGMGGMPPAQTMLGGVRRFDIAAMTAGTMSQTPSEGTELPLPPAAKFLNMGKPQQHHQPAQAEVVSMPVPGQGDGRGAAETGPTAGAPAQTGGAGQQSGGSGDAMPSRASALNLEAMLGTSLASAINSMEHQQALQQDMRGLGGVVGSSQGAYQTTTSAPTSGPSMPCSGVSSSSVSSASVSPDLPAGTPEMGGYDEPAQPHPFNMFRMLQRRNSDSPMSAPACPTGQGQRMTPQPGAGPSMPPPPPPHQQQPQHHHSTVPRPPLPYSMPFPHAAATVGLSPSPPTAYMSADGTSPPPLPAYASSPRPPSVGNGTPLMSGVGANSSGSGVSRMGLFETTTGIEMVQFLLETESRALILFNVEAIPSELLLLACEKMGSMSYFRADWRGSRGVAFVAYHDLRAAIRAFHTLGRELMAAIGAQGGEQRSVMVQYSIMLNAAQTPRDGILLVRDASGSGQAPPVSEGDLQAVFSSYGQLKNIHKRMGMGFLVEYYDTQDAKLAAYEMTGTTPWGPMVVVEEAERPEKEKQLGQQLLLTLHRWREEQRHAQAQAYTAATMPSVPHAHMSCAEQLQDETSTPGTCSSGTTTCCCCYNNSPQSSPNNISPPQLMYLKAASYPGLGAHSHPGSNGSTPTYVAYPAGSYSAVPQSPYHMLEGIPTQLDDSGMCSGFKGMWVTGHHHGVGTPSPKGMCAGRSPGTPLYGGSRRGVRGGIPMPMGTMAGMSMVGLATGDPEYQLDIDRVLKGLDKRTTIMIRNIPNKYTQALLLNEINLNHKGKYDFFYLPIDFKNKCNVGYAFINFIDYRSIVSFFKEFNGQRWKNFNSEKVCAISYARIQGKQSMISRFQNSSLMEKDGEYRPLLFHSNGLDRGKPEPFPMSSKQRRSSGNTTPTGISGLMFGLGGLGLGL